MDENWEYIYKKVNASFQFEIFLSLAWFCILLTTISRNPIHLYQYFKRSLMYFGKILTYSVDVILSLKYDVFLVKHLLCLWVLIIGAMFQTYFSRIPSRWFHFHVRLFNWRSAANEILGKCIVKGTRDIENPAFSFIRGRLRTMKLTIKSI